MWILQLSRKNWKPQIRHFLFESVSAGAVSGTKQTSNANEFMKEQAMQQSKAKLDMTITIGAVVVSSIFIVATLFSAEMVKEVFDQIFQFFIKNFGWTYLLIVAGFVLFSFLMAVSRYGNIRLGKDDEDPEFSLMAWFAMLFAAGMGIGLVFWGVAEPMFHYSTPPHFDAEYPQAAADTIRIAFFHWGLLCSTIAAMLLLTGGLKAVQTVSFIFSFPFMILMLFMMYAFFREISKEV